MLLHWRATLVSRTIHDLSVWNKPSSTWSMLSSQPFYPNMEDRSRASLNEYCLNYRMNFVRIIEWILLELFHKCGRESNAYQGEFMEFMTRFIRLWNSPQGGSFNFRCPCKNLIRIQLIATNLSWLVYFASLMEDELRRKTDTICITMRSRANFKADMKVALSSGKASSVFGPSLAKQR